MKRLLLGFAAAALAFSAAAQQFPSRTVRFVSGVTPGSASDTMARILAERMQATMGQPATNPRARPPGKEAGPSAGMSKSGRAPTSFASVAFG